MACMGPSSGPGPATGELRLRAQLAPRGPAAAVVLTDEQVRTIAGDAKTPAVQVTVNGHTFAGRIARRGGENLLGFNRAVREATRVTAGEEIELTITLDTAPREVEIPAPLAAALSDAPDARARFDGLATSHRKEFARWVAEAKRPETVARRVEQTLKMLSEGQTR